MGKTGLQLSLLSFGSWVSFHKQIDDTVAGELMGIAYDAGVNFFDNAEGYAEGKSMLYLEARCIYITKAAGVQGLQNGSVSCVGVPSAVPSGIRAILAEARIRARGLF